jgi:hypothetical protein
MRGPRLLDPSRGSSPTVKEGSTPIYDCLTRGKLSLTVGLLPSGRIEGQPA